MIYLLAKTQQKYKQRRNLVVIAPLIMAHYPYLNNLQFNPIIVKSKIFLFHSISCLMFIIIFFISYKLKFIKLYSKYHTVEVLFVDFYFSIIVPVNIYLKNPSMRKYLSNDLLNDFCLWIFSYCFSTFEYKTLKLITKVNFFWDQCQPSGHEFICFPPKKQAADWLIYLVFQLKACFLARNHLNTCPDSDLRINKGNPTF